MKKLLFFFVALLSLVAGRRQRQEVYNGAAAV